MDEECMEMHALVHGLVQGVGFRATTQHCARKLGLTGSVRNLADGVEIVAQGPKPKLEQLLPLLQQHSSGHIDSVTTCYNSCKTPNKDFRILN